MNVDPVNNQEDKEVEVYRDHTIYETPDGEFKVDVTDHATFPTEESAEEYIDEVLDGPDVYDDED